MPVDETVRHSDEERGVNVRKHLAPALLTVLVGAIGGGIWYSNGQLGEEHALRQLASRLPGVGKA